MAGRPLAARQCAGRHLVSTRASGAGRLSVACSERLNIHGDAGPILESDDMKKTKRMLGSVRHENAGQRKLSLSPSVFHRALMDRQTPAMSWQVGDFGGWRRRLRSKLTQLTGFPDAGTPRVPLDAKTLWTKTHERGTIEKIAFTAEPGADVLAYLCVPRQLRPESAEVRRDGRRDGGCSPPVP